MMNIEELYPKVTQAIRIAESRKACTGSVDRDAYAEVARLEEQIASLLPATAVEGMVARVGAIRASITAGYFDQANALALRFLSEPGVSFELRAAINNLRFFGAVYRRQVEYSRSAKIQRNMRLMSWFVCFGSACALPFVIESQATWVKSVPIALMSGAVLEPFFLFQERERLYERASQSLAKLLDGGEITPERLEEFRKVEMELFRLPAEAVVGAPLESDRELELAYPAYIKKAKRYMAVYYTVELLVILPAALLPYSLGVFWLAWILAVVCSLAMFLRVRINPRRRWREFCIAVVAAREKLLAAGKPLPKEKAIRAPREPFTFSKLINFDVPTALAPSR